MVGLIGTTLVFLSTPSARRATPCVPSAKRSKEISIHALREEGDKSNQAVTSVVHISCLL